MTSLGLEPQLVQDISLLSLPIDHLLVVGRRAQLIYLNMFSLACVINNRHISSHKITYVGFVPHRVNDTSLLSLPIDHLLVVGRRAQLIYLNMFSLACVINNRHISSHKMASVGLEPPLAQDTSLLSLPLNHLVVVGKQAQLIHLIFFSSLYN